MRVLVFGANGQVARELSRRGPHAGVTVVGLGRDACDLMSPGAARRAIEEAAPDAIINASAYTAVDKAESERDIAMRLNASAPSEIAETAAARAVPFIHFSTDYVFDGRGQRPWREDDPTGPLCVYGESKLAGEKLVAAAGGSQAILRISWVFSSHGSNFVKTMLRVAGERPLLRVVADQRGRPTPAAFAADAALVVVKALLADAGKSGVYHVAGDPPTTWADFAEAIVAAAGLSTPVERIATRDYPTPAKRPMYSVLDTEKFERAFGMKPPSWREALKDVVRELQERKS